MKKRNIILGISLTALISAMLVPTFSSAGGGSLFSLHAAQGYKEFNAVDPTENQGGIRRYWSDCAGGDPVFERPDSVVGVYDLTEAQKADVLSRRDDRYVPSFSELETSVSDVDAFAKVRLEKASEDWNHYSENAKNNYLASHESVSEIVDNYHKMYSEIMSMTGVKLPNYSGLDYNTTKYLVDNEKGHIFKGTSKYTETSKNPQISFTTSGLESADAYILAVYLGGTASGTVKGFVGNTWKTYIEETAIQPGWNVLEIKDDIYKAVVQGSITAMYLNFSATIPEGVEVGCTSIYSVNYVYNHYAAKRPGYSVPGNKAYYENQVTGDVSLNCDADPSRIVEKEAPGSLPIDHPAYLYPLAQAGTKANTFYESKEDRDADPHWATRPGGIAGTKAAVCVERWGQDTFSNNPDKSGWIFLQSASWKNNNQNTYSEVTYTFADEELKTLNSIAIYYYVPNSNVADIMFDIIGTDLSGNNINLGETRVLEATGSIYEGNYRVNFSMNTFRSITFRINYTDEIARQTNGASSVYFNNIRLDYQF